MPVETEDFRKQHGDPDAPEATAQRDIQTEYSDYVYSPSIRAVTKNNVRELRSVQVLSDNLEYLIIRQLSGSVGSGIKVILL
jgi:hypothetical protein